MFSFCCSHGENDRISKLQRAQPSYAMFKYIMLQWVQGKIKRKGVLSHGACTVQCFWNVHPASTPLNSPHRSTPRVPISAPRRPCWHTRNFYFLF